MVDAEKVPTNEIKAQHDAYRHQCPDCDHEPYKTAQAWWKHLREHHTSTFNDMATKIMRSMKGRDDAD